MPFDTMSFDTMPFNTMPYNTMPFDTMPFETMSFDDVADNHQSGHSSMRTFINLLLLEDIRQQLTLLLNFMTEFI